MIEALIIAAVITVVVGVWRGLRGVGEDYPRAVRATPVAGSWWIEGDSLHYIDQYGKERYITGALE